MLVNPSPHFDTKVVWGPHELIGLPADRAVVCVSVPWSANAPHIHSRGFIYRRVADGSEPRPETDRHVIDQLGHRADQIRKDYARWVEADPELLEGESGNPFLRVLIATDLWKNHGLSLTLTANKVRDIMNSKIGPINNIPFNNVYSSATGFIARQTEHNNPRYLSMTWRLHFDGRSNVLIPLNRLRGEKPDFLHTDLEGYYYGGKFTKILCKENHSYIDIIDVNFLFNILNGVIHIQELIQSNLGWDKSIHVKMRLLNTLRTCPFIDIEPILDIFEESGIPMVLDPKVEIRPGTDPETFIEIPSFDNVEPDAARVTSKTLKLYLPILQAFGISFWPEFMEGPGKAVGDELGRVGDRALESQARRNSRLAQGASQRRST
jgi:hypothetical protein